MNIRKTTFLAAVLGVANVAAAGCPFGYDQPANAVGGAGCERKLQNGAGQSQNQGTQLADFDAVKKDLTELMTKSQDFWPADFGHYGPFFIRLAWHCSGSYRTSDGRGGCDGGRIRHLPERAWADNTNLDKALTLITPIKEKYGASLSWGDLIVLAGTTAIESMGGPVLGFCGGRTDDADGTDSLQLGPSKEQQEVAPCAKDGDCKAPLGPTTLGLIYVNPEGPMGVPDPVLSAPQVRDTFGRMGMNDRETVALVGGGHAFGKTHGACPTGPGEDPIANPTNPWQGTCGTGPLKGKGNNTFTSGFEGAWTFNPTKWGNGYFKGLTGRTWEKFTGPGNHTQWRPVPDTNPPTRMLTADIALITDPAYKAISTEFANDLNALNNEFARAWYKLTSRDMGPHARCQGKLVPPAQPFQNPLPEQVPPHQLPNFDNVKDKIKTLLNTPLRGVAGGASRNAALFIHLAYQCASTFRITDYSGGCNGAKIRFAPMNTWPGNAGLGKVISGLETIKADFPTLSTADLIVLAGQVALEARGSEPIDFLGGRVDAPDGSNVDTIKPRNYYPTAVAAVKDDAKIRGLTAEEYVALAGRPRSAEKHSPRIFTDDITKVSNEFFKTLIGNTWEKQGKVYRAQGKDLFASETTVVLLSVPEYKAAIEKFANDEAAFKTVFAEAWAKLMTADHFSTKPGFY